MNWKKIINVGLLLIYIFGPVIYIPWCFRQDCASPLCGLECYFIPVLTIGLGILIWIILFLVAVCSKNWTIRKKKLKLVAILLAILIPTWLWWNILLGWGPDIYNLPSPIAKVIARTISRWTKDSFYFYGIVSLTSKDAAQLTKIKWRGEYLNFSNLKVLTPDVARELVKLNGSTLDLGGLTSLTLDTARELVNFKGDILVFNNKEIITPEVAEELDKFDGSISFPWIPD